MKLSGIEPEPLLSQCAPIYQMGHKGAIKGNLFSTILQHNFCELTCQSANLSCLRQWQLCASKDNTCQDYLINQNRRGDFIVAGDG